MLIKNRIIEKILACLNFDENPGTWGMFIDDFPPELFDKVVDFLESEDSWVLERDVEMSLDDEDANVYREYIPE